MQPQLPCVRNQWKGRACNEHLAWHEADYVAHHQQWEASRAVLLTMPHSVHASHTGAPVLLAAAIQEQPGG